MSRFISGLWENSYGLLVEDGQLAVGATAALAITWVIAQTGPQDVRENAGWLLLCLVLALVVANLYRAGRTARRRVR